MKVSRLLIVALLAASCDRETVADRSADNTEPAPVATAGETRNSSKDAPPPVEPRKPATQPGAVATPVADQAQKSGVNPNAAVLQDFKKRVDAYIDVRKQSMKDAPPLKETDDPAKLKAAQDALAVKIRQARATAKQGDIFTPEIAARFRRLLQPELTGEDGRDAKAVLKDDAPSVGEIPFKVNAKYPDGAPVPTVPANLLLNLPTLPEPLQYRPIGKHLILLDEDADVIVDYALNVIR
jgi:hypothetical protein